MTVGGSPVLDQEPTPELETECMSVLQAWLAGDLPFDEAVSQMNILNEQTQATGHVANQGRVEYLLGYLQGNRGNLSSAIVHYEKARELFLEVENETRVNRCDLNLGETYRLKGDFTNAQRLFHQAFEKAQQMDDVATQTIALSNEGQVLLSMKHIESAQQAFEEAYTLAREWPEDRLQTLRGLLCEIHHGLSVVYMNQGNTPAAWEQAKLAFNAAQEDGRPLQIGHANRTMGEIITMLDQIPPADARRFSHGPDEYFQVASQAFKEVPAEGEYARTLYTHARSLARRGRRVPAARKLQQATLIFARLGMVDDAAKAAEFQVEIF
jgi:tetratricopeptide (TPR) repeat protein